MKNIFLTFILLVQVISAQNKRFIYQYDFIPDSTAKDKMVKELMLLDITNGISRFTSQRKYISDSTIISPANVGKMVMPPMDLNIFYTIEKNNGIVFFKTNDYGLGKIKVEDNRDIKWNIFEEKQTFLTYTIQKASCSFGGRKWIAWFTQDIPLQDGPYKFHGLPGLIVKIEDLTRSHIFKLVGISNLRNDYIYPFRNKEMEEKKIDLTSFQKYYLQYRNDPGREIRQLYMQGKLPDQTDTSGNFRTGAEIVREVEALAKERIKKDNNIIEIDLLK
ncbi:GLPGLI family protein [Chryseobacterium gallinarum]|uniref:GLPGLI family protein n=1 Tax=Chryseobacterium gallinarum TaxID=1324352 RepID=A0ABX6KQR3_CHRGL|nr:GLPGLI family protein [Chryseobacterium gallinarum]QIY90967.1 GLPGLI family protein [Chryseobacterium gallinarum]